MKKCNLAHIKACLHFAKNANMSDVQQLCPEQKDANATPASA